MKKLISILIVFCVSAGVLTGCSTNGNSGDQLSIVTTTFAEYDWVREILGDRADNANITLLLDSGVDLHNFQPTADDIVTIAGCNMFIYVGGHSDEWVEDVLAQVKNEDMIVINLMDVLGDCVKEEEIVEGMEHEHEEDRAEDEYTDEDESEHEENHKHEDDEHVWLSLKNAKVICKEIAEKLCALDPENAETYTENLSAYCEKLSMLDEEYKKAVDEAPVKTLLFGDRFPFRYLVDDYGIQYYAAFSGCSAESEASFETIVFLAGKVDELGLSAVMTLEGSDTKIAQTVVDTSKVANAEILTLNSMQSITQKDINSGGTYLSIMASNLEVLKEALK